MSDCSSVCFNLKVNPKVFHPQPMHESQEGTERIHAFSGDEPRGWHVRAEFLGTLPSSV